MIFDHFLEDEKNWLRVNSNTFKFFGLSGQEFIEKIIFEQLWSILLLELKMA